ncbi:MAG: hypothetical protein HYX27_01915 [Acidobacteria bacterium]|nr:hypothetical protein [Acidobacteriota bacterium]
MRITPALKYGYGGTSQAGLDEENGAASPGSCRNVRRELENIPYIRSES